MQEPDKTFPSAELTFICTDHLRKLIPSFMVERKNIAGCPGDRNHNREPLCNYFLNKKENKVIGNR